ncbi:MAG: PEGA domain-containing protein [bacterium]
MKKTLLLTVLGVFFVTSLIWGAEPEVRTIIITPPPESNFQVDVWTNKGDNTNYYVGENLIVYFKVTQDAYIYLWDINANGEIRLFFPNRYQQNNFVRANTVYSIPSPQDNYSLTIAPPYGREVVHILASKSPINVLENYRKNMEKDPLPLIPENPEDFTNKVKKNIEIVPNAPQWTTNNTIFYVVQGTTPGQVFPGQNQNLGELTVSSNPSGASLYIDGRFLGYTPYDGNVPVGKHSILLQLSGYQDYQKDINITPARPTKIDVKLKPIPLEGSLYITSNPSGADVFINGDKKGKTPLRIGGLKPGQYQITIIKSGYETFVQYYPVFLGQTVNVNVQLYPIR